MGRNDNYKYEFDNTKFIPNHLSAGLQLMFSLVWLFSSECHLSSSLVLWGKFLKLKSFSQRFKMIHADDYKHLSPSVMSQTNLVRLYSEPFCILNRLCVSEDILNSTTEPHHKHLVSP